MRPVVTKPSENDKAIFQNYVNRVFECLITNTRLSNNRKIHKLWKKYWGYPAYPDSISKRKLILLTNRRKSLLLRLFRMSTDIIHTKHISVEDAKLLKSRLFKYRKQTSSYKSCMLLAVDAALAHQILKANSKNKKLKLALCYSAFGSISGIANRYAKELYVLFANIFEEIHVYAAVKMHEDIPKVPKIPSVDIHIRRIYFSELVAFPGIKAAGLVAACADAVRDGADLIITIDGDGRLPLFETLPAFTQILEFEDIDVVLGSRRVAGGLVSKPGVRHLSSTLFAAYVEAILTPVLGKVRDPQAIFKVFKRKQLSCALEKLGFNKKGKLLFNDLQSGSFAFELPLLSFLSEDGSCPNIIEVPAIETMAYPAKLEKMLIMTSSNIKAMVADANKPVINVKEYSLIEEGTEVFIINRYNGEVWKIPRDFERLANFNLFPTSIVTDNRILHFFMSLPRFLKTLVEEYASRSHNDRGFGFNSTLFDLLRDSRFAVKECLPLGLRVDLVENAIRLPFPTAILMIVFWKFDRFICNSGALLIKIGMLPIVEIRAIGFTFRFICSILRWLKFVTFPVLRVFRKTFSLFLSFCDWAKYVFKMVLHQTIYSLEIVKVLRIFVFIDFLDQRNRFFHSCIRIPICIFKEIHWLLESFNISVNLGRPVLCLVQPQTIRPFWKVLKGIPNSMTDEIQSLLNMALKLYKTLGENGYYDGEFSLDNLGFVLDCDARIVLIDYGSLINAKKSRAELLRPWLMNIKKDYEKSYQVYKLQEYAKSNPKAEKIIKDHTRDVVELIDKWILQT